MPFTNTGKEPIAYRDDAGKHHVAPGGTFELVGPQHAAAVLAIPGVEVATEAPATEAPATEQQSAEAEPEATEKPERRAVRA